MSIFSIVLMHAVSAAGSKMARSRPQVSKLHTTSPITTVIIIHTFAGLVLLALPPLFAATAVTLERSAVVRLPLSDLMTGE